MRKTLLLGLFLLLSLALVSAAQHPTYPAFSLPEGDFTITDNLVTLNDDVVYHIGYYYLEENGNWEPFALAGESYLGSTIWKTGETTATLPDFGDKDYFVIAYSCTKGSTEWDCHGGRWQLYVVKDTAMLPREGDYVAANNELAMDLYEHYKTEDGNMFFSSYSISSALTMTYEGAKGQTAQEMKNVLHLPDDKEQLRTNFHDLYLRLNQADKPYILSTANALWAQEDFLFEEDYLNTVDTYYKGGVSNLDFKTQAEPSRIIINEWVEEQTHDRIQDLIPMGMITSATRLVLTNAVYFKGNWSQKFKPEATKNDSFYVTPDNPVTTEMMVQSGRFGYVYNEIVQILELDYLSDDLSMLILLPSNNDLATLEASLTTELLEELRPRLYDADVIVWLPKFTFETKYFMAQDLKEMGMPTAFTGAADFSGITTEEGLAISEVIHQTFIEVKEAGTEAAAATAVIMKATSAGPVTSVPIEFRADRPFIFIIQEKETGAILFMGRLSDPTQ